MLKRLLLTLFICEMKLQLAECIKVLLWKSVSITALPVLGVGLKRVRTAMRALTDDQTFLDMAVMNSHARLTMSDKRMARATNCLTRKVSCQSGVGRKTSIFSTRQRPGHVAEDHDLPHGRRYGAQRTGA